VKLLDKGKLQQSGVPSAAQRLHLVPALILDGDEDIDVRDKYAMNERADVRAPALFATLHAVGCACGLSMRVQSCDEYPVSQFCC
jgi:hypothetical protein